MSDLRIIFLGRLLWTPLFSICQRKTKSVFLIGNDNKCNAGFRFKEQSNARIGHLHIYLKEQTTDYERGKQTDFERGKQTDYDFASSIHIYP